MKAYQVPTTNKERKPILYWMAKQGGHTIDTNNSIALLRYKYGGTVTYHAVR